MKKSDGELGLEYVLRWLAIRMRGAGTGSSCRPLARYLGAIGADLHLVVRFEGRPPVELSLDELPEP